MAYHLDPYDNALVIDGFQKGIADNPYDGIADMRNVNIISVPGEASVNFSTVQASLNAISGNITSTDGSGDTATTNVDLSVDGSSGMAVTFTGLDSVGIVTGTVYWAGTFTSFRTFKLYTNPNLQPANLLNITGNSTGTFATVNMGKPVGSTYYKTTDRYFIIDSNGRVWEYNSSGWRFMGNTVTSNVSNGNGIIAWRGYLFVFTNNKIDYMLLSGNTWTAGWKTLNTASGVNNSHYALIGQDDVIYYCDGTYLGSILKKTNGPPDTIVFDPADTATYTWSQQALGLPSTDIAQCLAELGVNLLIGGQKNAIYPWNRVATSFTYPILLAENFVSKMVTVNTNTYALVGNRGRIYITNGSQAQLFKKIPDHISGTVEPYYQWGDLTSVKNQIYFGVKATDNAGVAINTYGGVWAIDLDDESIRMTNKLSYGTYAGLATVIQPLFISPSSFTPGTGLYIGWDSGNSTFGMDSSSSSPYTSSQASIDTDLVPIGTFNKPRDFAGIEYRLSKPMVNGESISVYYRKDFSQSYTLIFTDTATATYLPFSKFNSVNFANAQWVQFQIVLNSVDPAVRTPSYVRLRQIRILGITQPLSS